MISEGNAVHVIRNVLKVRYRLFPIPAHRERYAALLLPNNQSK